MENVRHVRGVRERRGETERGRSRRRLGKQRHVGHQPDARRVQHRRERVVGAVRARRDDARQAPRERLTEEHVERPHLVAAVHGRRTIVAFDEELGRGASELASELRERLDRRRPDADARRAQSLAEARKTSGHGVGKRHWS